MTNSKKWFKITVLNFLIAACYGLLLRYAFVAEINWIDFRNLMHGHSHVAMLGWLYLALYLLFIQYFIKENRHRSYYTVLFILTEITVIGMAISFPIQGYGPISIALSTLHVFFSYAFIIRFILDLRETPNHGSQSALLAKTALYFMFLSTLALFAMAPIMMMNLKASNLYYMAVQFFLHFQFNGWFIFGVLAIFFKLLEDWKIIVSRKKFKTFYWTMVISCILSYAMAVTWSNPSAFLFLLNSIGVLIQLWAILVFIQIVQENYQQIKSRLDKKLLILLSLSFASFVIKIVVQSAVVIPFIARISYTIRNYVIGFIHLILLGIITFAIFAFAANIKYLKLEKKMAIAGISVLASGIFLSEFIIFLQGTLLWASWGFMPFYYELICIVSALMPLGIVIILISMYTGRSLGGHQVAFNTGH